MVIEVSNPFRKIKRSQKENRVPSKAKQSEVNVNLLVAASSMITPRSLDKQSYRSSQNAKATEEMQIIQRTIHLERKYAKRWIAIHRLRKLSRKITLDSAFGTWKAFITNQRLKWSLKLRSTFISNFKTYQKAFHLIRQKYFLERSLKQLAVFSQKMCVKSAWKALRFRYNQVVLYQQLESDAIILFERHLVKRIVTAIRRNLRLKQLENRLNYKCDLFKEKKHFNLLLKWKTLNAKITLLTKSSEENSKRSLKRQYFKTWIIRMNDHVKEKTNLRIAKDFYNKHLIHSFMYLIPVYFKRKIDEDNSVKHESNLLQKRMLSNWIQGKSGQII
jgi:hypothetical protein